MKSMYSDFLRPMIDLDEEAIETKTSTKECRGMKLFVLKKWNEWRIQIVMQNTDSRVD